MHEMIDSFKFIIFGISNSELVTDGIGQIYIHMQRSKMLRAAQLVVLELTNF